jgi:2',3'-cyclic-nucleotide 2'-phosphodiesterase (5'-nucleotidase family)
MTMTMSSVIGILVLAVSSIASSHQIPLQAVPQSTLGSDSALSSTLPKPTRPLQWGTLNILSTTDTHGWLRGHTHSSHIPESLYSASIADVASFHEHLSNKADELGVDLLLVDSGDTVDGNGFVDADTSGVKGHMARRLLQQVGYDVATAGNHEVGADATPRIAYEAENDKQIHLR